MTENKYPTDEFERLLALKKINLLDSSTDEDAYNTITQLVAEECAMPISLICLVDSERVWFKSKFGLAEEHKEVPREKGFCPYTIQETNLFEVKDASKDKRFADCPLVTQGGFKFYAGFAIRDADGYALGTLCVMDYKPRELPLDKQKFLQKMSLVVSALMQPKNDNPDKSTQQTLLYEINNKNTNFSNAYPKVFIIEADEDARTHISNTLKEAGFITEEYSDAKPFLERYNNQPGCVITEAKSEKINGMLVQEVLKDNGMSIPIIFLATESDVKTSVTAMRAGALDYIEKPFTREHLISSVNEAIILDAKQRKKSEQEDEILRRFTKLTSREREIMSLLVCNHAEFSNKEIAAKLAISPRTVEVHRSSVMAKMLARTRAELVDFAKICEGEST